MKVRVKKVLRMNGELWQKLDAHQSEMISGGGQGQAGRIDINELKPADLLQGGTAKQPEAEGKIRGTLILTF